MRGNLSKRRYNSSETIRVRNVQTIQARVGGQEKHARFAIGNSARTRTQRTRSILATNLRSPSCSMPKSCDRDALLRVVEFINNPIFAEDEFAQSLELKFRHDSADTGMSRDRAGATNK